MCFGMSFCFKMATPFNGRGKQDVKLVQVMNDMKKFFTYCNSHASTPELRKTISEYGFTKEDYPYLGITWRKWSGMKVKYTSNGKTLTYNSTKDASRCLKVTERMIRFCIAGHKTSLKLPKGYKLEYI